MMANRYLRAWRTLLLVVPALLLWLAPIVRGLIFEAPLPYWIAIALVTGGTTVLARNRLNRLWSF